MSAYRAPMPSVTLSVISHEQHSLVDALLADLAGIAAPERARIVVTQNLGEPPPATQGMRLPPLQVVRNPRPRGFGANHNSVFARCEHLGWFPAVEVHRSRALRCAYE